MMTKGKWKIVDEDRHQIFRKIGDDTYEFYQATDIGKIPELHVFWISHAVFSEDEIEMEDVLDSFGFDSVESIKAECGDEYMQIIAECWFELNAIQCVISQKDRTFEEAKELIDTLIVGDKISIETPAGTMCAETKGVYNEYPGILTYMEDQYLDGTSEIMAAAEYDTCAERLQTASYYKGSDDPRTLIDYETGDDLL